MCVHVYLHAVLPISIHPNIHTHLPTSIHTDSSMYVDIHAYTHV